MTPEVQAVCQQLRSEIVRAGWSRTARLCSIDRTWLHRAFPAEPNGRVPSFKTVIAVAAVFGLQIAMVPAFPAENPTSEAE